MVYVYANGFLYIVATGATDGDQGLFIQRDPLMYSLCQMAAGTDEKLYAFPSQYNDATRPDLRACFIRSNLHTKGKEWVLPARTLSFGSVFFWDCREKCHGGFILSIAGRYGPKMGSLLGYGSTTTLSATHEC